MNSKQILDNLSGHLKNTLARAIGLATSLKHPEVNPLHLFVSTLQEKGSLGSEILLKLKCDEKALMTLLENKKIKTPKGGYTTTATLSELSALSKKALEKAMLLAYEYEQNYVGTEHLLYGIIHTHDKDIDEVYALSKFSPEDLEDQIIHILESANKFPDVEDISAMMEEMTELGENTIITPPPAPPVGPTEESPAATTQTKSTRPTALELFTVDLTDYKEQKDLDPVIGRADEIDRLINILCRRTKNNPVLVGEPGVGKTAIVEGLAKRIASGDVPDILKLKKILSLDLTLLISGTIYRGEFEGRLRQLIEEISKKHNYILFIDEIHNIIGAGSNQGTMDAANILKPALARGKLRCIGATTLDEYKKYISSDPALERRFQSVSVEEPSRDDAVKILQGIIPLYENYHNVTVAPEIAEKIVDLSIKFIHDNFLPDKAIDILDEACASVRVKAPTHPLRAELLKIEREYKNILREKQESILAEQFEKAKKFKAKEEKLNKQLDELEKKTDKMKPSKSVPVTLEDIAHVLSKRLHTQKNIFLQDEFTELQTIRDTLKQEIIGQNAVIEQVVQTLERSSLGFKNNKRPFASFFFVGPTGVGKTQMAKVLARNLYHDEKALIKMDMSEFSEQHGISKILGSPAGYIGYKERNHFTENLRKRPYSVVLFDEIDKAHPDVIKLLLQILDEGELTESNGKKVSFKNATIILTSNVGAELFKSSGLGFGTGQKETDAKIQSAKIFSTLKEHFGAPLLGRVGTTCIFTPLSPENISQIIEKNVHDLSLMITSGLSLNVSVDNSATLQIQAELEKDLGARPIEATLERILLPLYFELKKNLAATKKQNSKNVRKNVSLSYEKGAFSLK